MTDLATVPASPGEHVILVDRDDVPVGIHAKQDAHVEGLLHRAFSIFVFDTHGRALLQRRAIGKYHSGGLWSNTCCSHPRPGESTMAAAQRRLFEEMGFNCPLITACSFVYRADVGGGLIEHEYDHVFIGHFDGDPAPDPAEVEDWLWLGVEELKREVRGRPDRFTYWFHIAWRELEERGFVRPVSGQPHGSRLSPANCGRDGHTSGEDGAAVDCRRHIPRISRW